MFMTPLFDLRILWLPEMRMRQLWMVAVRQPQMPQTMLAVSVGVPPGNDSNHPGTGQMGCVFLFWTH